MQQVMSYVRYNVRERYETLLVEALVAIGYDIALSSDLADEVFGEDARDLEYDIGWDFFIGAKDSPYLVPKLVKALERGLAVFHVPGELMDDLCLPSRRQTALAKLANLYEEALCQAQERSDLRTGAELVGMEERWLHRHHSSTRVLQVA